MTQLATYQESIRIRGQVQGVGFRPTVWRLARQFDICGQVRNDGSGVEIIAQSSADRIARMLQQLRQQPPPLARIDSIEREVIELDATFDEFVIECSGQGEIATAIVADAASCEACLAEIFDPHDRRYGYAFTNCTHCGPRLSIMRELPYDRRHTSMDEFVMCPACQQEYDNPHDRRFHAQPNACPECGPRLQLCRADGSVLQTDDAIAQTAHWIRQGKIVAIKGTGGFQLACDASNAQAVARLRQRKQRPHKALALMAATLAQITEYARVDANEAALLQSSAAPIVLLDARAGAKSLAAGIADGIKTLGFMLPHTPLHHCLMRQLDTPLVLTSGNAVNRPQCIDNAQALTQLADIADLFLLHDRAVLNRLDDTVMRIMAGQAHVYRRARGLAPQPITLPASLSRASVLACGSEMKNSFCLARHGQATLSQHIGNLDQWQNQQDYQHQLDLYQRLYDFQAQAIAVDSHPQYQASQFGRALAQQAGIELIEVQHHHAHIAACLADNGWTPGSAKGQNKVIGIALDGLGYGEDGTIWGGEFLIADYCGFERHARLKPAAMAGGNLASIEPWRNAFAQLVTHADWARIEQQYAALPFIKMLQRKPLDIVENMMRNGLNAPLTSSCGRLFDAVACALGLCTERQSYEGQAAIELENLFDTHQLTQQVAYPFALGYQQGLLEINPAPMWQALLQDLADAVDVSVIAARFHRGLAQVIVATTVRLRDEFGINSVALGGGVFQNRSLLELCVQALTQQGFNVLQHQSVPANDGGLALGQAAVAAARINHREHSTCV